MATTEIYTLSLHDALPISKYTPTPFERIRRTTCSIFSSSAFDASSNSRRSEEHTSELQSRQYLVCRLLLEKKKKQAAVHAYHIVKFHKPLHPHSNARFAVR